MVIITIFSIVLILRQKHDSYFAIWHELDILLFCNLVQTVGYRVPEMTMVDYRRKLREEIEWGVGECREDVGGGSQSGRDVVIESRVLNVYIRLFIPMTCWLGKKCPSILK